MNNEEVGALMSFSLRAIAGTVLLVSAVLPVLIPPNISHLSGLSEPGVKAELGVFKLEQSAEPYDAIRVDHFELIQGPARPKATPWESVYRTEMGLIFGPSTLDVREHYLRFGLKAPRKGYEPDDHISLELQFCAQLLVKGVSANEESSRLEADH